MCLNRKKQGWNFHVSKLILLKGTSHKFQRAATFFSKSDLPNCKVRCEDGLFCQLMDFNETLGGL